MLSSHWAFSVFLLWKLFLNARKAAEEEGEEDYSGEGEGEELLAAYIN
jgi:hypothetical protein